MTNPASPSEIFTPQSGGGAFSTPVTGEAVRVAAAEGVSVQEVVKEDRHDDLMAAVSVEGRPPSVWMRYREWGWLAFVLGAVVLGVIIWEVSVGASVGTIAGWGGVFLVMLVIGGAPVLGAGLMRGKEEREVTKVAAVEKDIQHAPLVGGREDRQT